MIKETKLYVGYAQRNIKEINKQKCWQILQTLNFDEIIRESLGRGVGLMLFSILLKKALEKSVNETFNFVFGEENLQQSLPKNIAINDPLEMKEELNKEILKNEKIAEEAKKALERGKKAFEKIPLLASHFSEVDELDELTDEVKNLKAPDDFQILPLLEGISKRWKTKKMIKVEQFRKQHRILIVAILLLMFLNGDISLERLREILSYLGQTLKKIKKILSKWVKKFQKKFKQFLKCKELIKDFLFIIKVLQSVEYVCSNCLKPVFLSIVLWELQKALVYNLDEKTLLSNICSIIGVLNLPFIEKVKILAFIQYQLIDLFNSLKRLKHFFD